MLVMILKLRDNGNYYYAASDKKKCGIIQIGIRNALFAVHFCINIAARLKLFYAG